MTKKDQEKKIRWTFRRLWAIHFATFYAATAFVLGNLNLLQDSGGRLGMLAMSGIAIFTSVFFVNAALKGAVEQGVQVDFKHCPEAREWLQQNVHASFCWVDRVEPLHAWSDEDEVATAYFVDRDQAMMFKLAFGGAR